jgi:hypothetical protein
MPSWHGFCDAPSAQEFQLRHPVPTQQSEVEGQLQLGASG